MPPVLAHYTKIETLIEHILPEQKLKLSKLTELNDPLENRFKYDDMTQVGWNGPPVHCWEELSHEYQNLANRIKICCFSAENMQKPNIQVYKKMRMWAQYAQNHKGVCILFDKEKLISKLSQKEQLLHTGEVIYHEKLPTTTFSLTEDDFNKNYQENYQEKIFKYLKELPYETIFAKTNGWCDEDEFRIAVYSKSEITEFIDVEDCITKIILGLETPLIYKNLIKSISPEVEVKNLIHNMSGIEIARSP